MKLKYNVFDCDIHQTYKHQSELYPYLREPHLQRVKEKGLGYPAAPYTSSLHYKRQDTFSASGTGGSDIDFTSYQLFTEMGISCGVLNGHGIFALPYIPEVEYPAALAWAYNRWMIDHWLEKDTRYFGSLHLALQNPGEMARMIRELGRHQQVIQAIIPSQTPLPITHEFYQPVIEAIADMDLVLAFHPWQPAITTHASTPIGNPASYIEWRTLAGLPAMAQLVSVVFKGILVRFPALKCIFLESGFSWLIFYLWRMDQLYKSFRSDVPWLKMLPSEYILQRCKFGTQPMEEPPQNDQMHRIIEMIYGNHCLVYTSDYPHWDADNPEFTASFIPAEYREDILYNNAIKLYGLENIL